jgi:L-fuconolactonase
MKTMVDFETHQATGLRTRRIDAHQHFWHYSPEQYSWIDASMGKLQCDLLPQHLAPELQAARIDGVVTVQACHTVAETEWLLQLAENYPWILGVVGWAPIDGRNFHAELERLSAHPKLKGLRHIVQAEPDPEFLLRASFAAGMRALRETGLVYDLLIVEHQLPQAIRFVDQHPNQVFVLDHVAKPKIAGQVLEPWRSRICELARRQNVYCKLSGMVTEAAWDCWTCEDLRPHVEVVLQAFGPRRIMAGSDWPVCMVAATYGQWFKTLEVLLAGLSPAEKARIFGGTAIEAYRLDSCCAQSQGSTHSMA